MIDFELASSYMIGKRIRKQMTDYDIHNKKKRTYENRLVNKSLEMSKEQLLITLSNTYIRLFRDHYTNATTGQEMSCSTQDKHI